MSFTGWSSRQRALRSFISTIGGPSYWSSSPASLQLQRRPFSYPGKQLNEARERIQQPEHAPNDIDNHALGPSRTKEPDVEDAPAPHIPWYLQNRPPGTANDTFIAARQKLPDIPEHPPLILEPLLQHVSVDLGIDDLALLDLRALDPPPALGANLLMLVGTARSEKHVHIAADRLCRWLRTEHRLAPFADGLLGRNELKLQSRRRAKRARLFTTVGTKSTAETEAEDGMRTGWVCVNVGKVGGGELPREDAEEGFIGFGSRKQGCQVVVQIMTEERRGALDLEKLWTGIITRARKEKEIVQRELEGERMEET